MKPMTIWKASVDLDSPVEVAWEAIFLHKPNHEHIKEAIRNSIADESRLSQTEKAVQMLGYDEEEITQAMQNHMAGLAWLVKQEDVEFSFVEETAWNNGTI